MTVNKMVHLLVGIMVVLGVVLSLYVNENWIWLSAFVGASLAQSAITNLCPLGVVLEKLGVPSGHASEALERSDSK